ncbi:MAG: DUF1579 domain-containing protein [Planctomycetaceae bacterium]
MKKLTIAYIAMALLSGGTFVHAQEMPKMPPPVPYGIKRVHIWLQQFVGEWESESEVFMEPGKPPMKSKGTESSRMIGAFWVVAEGKGDMMGKPFTSLLTLGYDPGKDKYIGSWIDSTDIHLWRYEGTVDPTGKILTLETEGPCSWCPMAPEGLSKFKAVTEFKSKDHRVFTSSIQGKDGKWTTVVTVNSRRKK